MDDPDHDARILDSMGSNDDNVRYSSFLARRKR